MPVLDLACAPRTMILSAGVDLSPLTWPDAMIYGFATGLVSAASERVLCLATDQRYRVNSISLRVVKKK